MEFHQKLFNELRTMMKNKCLLFLNKHLLVHHPLLLNIDKLLRILYTVFIILVSTHSDE